MAVSRSKGLWDSDDEDVVLSLEKAKTTKVVQQTRSKPSLFDSGDEEDTFIHKASINNSKNETTLFNSEPINEKDYEKLYVREVSKNKELEGVIARLQEEVAALKTKLLQASVGDLDLAHNPIVENSKDAEWEVLAREEKQRRQRAIQQKATRQRTVNKRPAGTTAAPAASVADLATEDTDIGVVPTTERVLQGRHYLDSDEGEDETLVQPKQVRSVEVAVDAGAASSLSPTNTEGGESESEKPIANQAEEVIVEDPETVKWRELAAQEKARKALARRSVRVVRRGGANGGAEGGGSGDVAVKHKHLLLSAYTHIKSSNSLQNLAVAATASSTTTAESTTSVPNLNSASADHSSAGGRSCAHAHFDSESDWDTNSHSDDSESGDDDNACVGERAGDNNNTREDASPVIDSMTAAEEAALDRRLRAWASGKSIAQLLCTLPSVVELASQELLISGDVSAAAEVLSVALANSSSNGQSAAGDVRKAYMRVIRHCHPDKHMHLPPRSPAFLELQKLFTVLSDSYNRYKAAQS